VKLAIPTPDGEFIARYSEHGLSQLSFPGDCRTMADDSIAPANVEEWHAATIAALKEILAGRTPTALPPLDLTRGTDFQRQVWEVLRKIGPGHTKSYGEVAAAIGNPEATRAVGAACGANPVPPIIPCHRVLAAKGKLGGFSGTKGWKEKLLAREGVHLF